MSDIEYCISDRLYAALRYAFELHGRDARKSSKIPVMAHLLAVCALVQMETDNEDDAVAALLHDALEDKPNDGKTREKILDRFGKKVLRIIDVSSDTPIDFKGGPKLEWRERKQAYIDHVKATNPDLLRVSVADKIDNVRAILAEHEKVGDDFWKKFRTKKKEDQIWYYSEVLKAYEIAGYKGVNLDDLKELVSKLQELRIKTKSCS